MQITITGYILLSISALLNSGMKSVFYVTPAYFKSCVVRFWKIRSKWNIIPNKDDQICWW